MSLFCRCFQTLLHHPQFQIPLTVKKFHMGVEQVVGLYTFKKFFFYKLFVSVLRKG